jgi:hypothetical protein
MSNRPLRLWRRPRVSSPYQHALDIGPRRSSVTGLLCLRDEVALLEVEVAAVGPVGDGECCSCSLGRRHQILKPPRRMNRNRDHRTRPRADHNKLILQGLKVAQPSQDGQARPVCCDRTAVHLLPASRKKLAIHRTRQDKVFHTPLLPTSNKPAALQICPVIEAQVNCGVHRKLASTLASDCPAGAIIARIGRVESAVGPKSYKHKDYLKLSASASLDPGAQLTLQIALASPRFTHR